MLYNNLLELIGNTPLLRLTSIIDKRGVEVFAKLEGQNPGGSIKDRAALTMIEAAEKSGLLDKGKTILEPSSGNTGIALAMIGARKGYRVLITMSAGASIERAKMIRAFGAEIIETKAGEGTDGAIRKAEELLKAEPEKYIMLDQFSNPANKQAHYLGTANEIWSDLDGKLDYVVSSIGTSGTLMGIKERLHELDQNIKVVCAYPERGHRIQGLKNMEEAIVPKLFQRKKIDEYIEVTSDDAFRMARQAMKQEGISSGMSGGAALQAASVLASRINKGRIVVLIPDRAERYLSTELF